MFLPLIKVKKIQRIFYWFKIFHSIVNYNKISDEILAYVIMPTHFHWLIMVNPKYGTVSDIMRDIKNILPGI